MLIGAITDGASTASAVYAVLYFELTCRPICEQRQLLIGARDKRRADGKIRA